MYGFVSGSSFTVIARTKKLFIRSVSFFDKNNQDSRMPVNFGFSQLPQETTALYKYNAPPLQEYIIPVEVTINNQVVKFDVEVTANWPLANAALAKSVAEGKI
jgi:hypothetical protein